ncbi:MAG: hypothetical protein ACOC3Z_00385 [Nanoarchaeota archaeon]
MNTKKNNETENKNIFVTKTGERRLKKDKAKNFKDKYPLKDNMAYYCKLCGCWHYPGSKNYYAHRIYASKKHKPRKVVKRRSPTKRWRI